MARNHLGNGTMVLSKMVPDKTLKLDLQPWQFHRPIRCFALLLPPYPLTAAMGTTGVLAPALLLQVPDTGLLVGKTLADADQVHGSP